MLKDWLYKLDSNGQMRVWRMELSDVSPHYRTISGLKLGEKVTTGWVEARPTQRQQDPFLQAIAEVGSIYARALKTDYHATEEEALRGPRHTEPMLCKDYEKIDPKRFGVHSDWDAEPKLDGIRAVLKAEGGFSRTGERFLTVRLVMEALAGLFARDPLLVLDGELYNHAYHDRFNELSGMIRKGVNAKRAPTADELAMAEAVVQYHVYDVPSHPGTREERRAFLEALDLDSPYLRLVPAERVASREHFEAVAERHVAEGYEGTIYKRRSALYQLGKRPWDQLKRKVFETREFRIKRVEEGEGDWKGAVKRVVYDWDDGREFASGLRMSVEDARRWWLQSDRGQFTGPYGFATVRFMPPPQGALPRVATAIDFHGPKGRTD